jgi:hypothetical protein
MASSHIVRTIASVMESDFSLVRKKDSHLTNHAVQRAQERQIPSDEVQWVTLGSNHPIIKIAPNSTILANYSTGFFSPNPADIALDLNNNVYLTDNNTLKGKYVFKLTVFKDITHISPFMDTY